MKLINAQVIICGASLGGTLAAYSAVREGKKTVLLEKIHSFDGLFLRPNGGGLSPLPPAHHRKGGIFHDILRM